MVDFLAELLGFFVCLDFLALCCFVFNGFCGGLLMMVVVDDSGCRCGCGGGGGGFVL